MKIIIIAFIISTVSCKAQTPVLDLYTDRAEKVEGGYYKDTQNFQNQYIGTWLYTNGNTSLKIIFVKKVMFPILGSPKNYFEDILVGEYQYIENGVEKVNTLANLNVNHTNEFDYNLLSISQLNKNKYPKCNECADNEKRLNMELMEPSRRNFVGFDNGFLLRRVTENGVVMLKVNFVKMDNGVYSTKEGDPVSIDGFSLPYGNYTLIKQ